MDLWEALEITDAAVVACTGAGGKTSLLTTLAACGHSRSMPVLVTATTKMYTKQIQQWDPITTTDLVYGMQQAAADMVNRGIAAWFSRCEGGKAVGLPSGHIDRLVASLRPPYCLLVEADGAREKLLKAPATHEPVVPEGTTHTVGVLNAQALGRPLEAGLVHRLDKTCEVLNKEPGEDITLHDLAILASHRQGIFQYYRGRCMLVIAGSETLPAARSDQLLQLLRNYNSPATRLILTKGYGSAMEPVGVYSL